MIDNLGDVLANMRDLLELKKERLRVLWESEKILKAEIVELEHGLASLTSASPKSDRFAYTDVHARDVVAFIREHGAVTRGMMAAHFRVTSKRLSLSWLVKSGQLVKDGTDPKGHALFRVPTLE